MKTKPSLLAVFLLLQLPALGQGQFLFNTHDPGVGNDVRFYWFGPPASAPDLFVQVLVSSQPSNFQPVGTPMALNRTGASAGYTNPFAQLITTSLAAGSVAYVGYSMFQGTSYDKPIDTSPPVFKIIGGTALISVVLSAPPSPPNEVGLGAGSVTFSIPEPRPLTLAVIGASLFALWGWFGRWSQPVRN